MSEFRIHLVTPSFNCPELLEETVRSVCQAALVPLHYEVWEGSSNFDALGGATDLLKTLRAEIHLGEDSGQFDALQRAFEVDKGEIMGWINSGDILFPWSLKLVHQVFSSFPEIRWIYGLPTMGSDGIVKRVGCVKPLPRALVRIGLCAADGIGYLSQEAMFWRRDVYEQAGGIAATFDLIADYDLWTRFAQHATPVSLPSPLAMFAQHGTNRSQKLKSKAECELHDWKKNLPPNMKQERERLAKLFGIIRRVARFSRTLAVALGKVYGLSAFSGQVLEWNSRSDALALNEKRLLIEDLF